MIKLLLDANLSYRLVKKLKEKYPNCVHVTRTGLPIPATDREIWNWAKTNGYSIVSNDEDFENLLTLNGFPPKIIILRFGNQSTKFVTSVLLSSYETINDFYNDPKSGLLEIN